MRVPSRVIHHAVPPVVVMLVPGGLGRGGERGHEWVMEGVGVRERMEGVGCNVSSSILRNCVCICAV